MAKKSIGAVDVSGKRVLIRVDFNVPLKDGEITDSRRIEAALPTIKSIIDRGGKAVLMSHLGRPAGSGYESKYSLEVVAKKLAELLGKLVSFPSQDCTDDAALAAVDAMNNGDVLLLENLRFNKDEIDGNTDFAGKLAAMGDVFVNDAFGTCHRPHASMVGVPKAMKATGDKPCVVGFLVEKEIKFLTDAIKNPAKPFVVVLGGAKVSDKMAAIEHLLPMADTIIVGGAMAYTFLKAQGKDIGDSRIESDRIDDAKRAIDLAAKLDAELYLPKDHICGKAFDKMGGGDIEVFGEHIKDGYMGLDIGPKTQSEYCRAIKKAKTIVWNGPMGVYEWRPFRVGTEQIAKAIAEATTNGATSIVGGGDSAAAVEQFGLADKFSHVSTGGGASLEMLEGKSFEAVGVLDDA
ncbi:MAG: phosphoglycerate kinase [Phycisphaera sp.]|nr:MAG: phosphoglycerate kinase [Phycisphaera sp.]